MHDNLLTLVDMRTLGASEPMTPEGAMFLAQAPLIDCGKHMDRVAFTRLVLRVAREYVVDYDLVRACARAGVEWELCRHFERDTTFITAVDMMRRELTPEEIITRAEVMGMLKREAATASKARDRVAAMKELAKIAGFTKDEEADPRGHVPVINITLQGGPADRPPVVNVTPAPRPVARGSELL